MLATLKDIKIYIIAILVGFFGPPALIVFFMESLHVSCKLHHCIIPYLG